MKNTMRFVLKQFAEKRTTPCNNKWCNCLEYTLYYLSRSPDEFSKEEIMDRVVNIRCDELTMKKSK
jgi:hypothetical protein